MGAPLYLPGLPRYFQHSLGIGDLMFEQIEKANEGRDMLVAMQNHPAVMLSFVWDTKSESFAAQPESRGEALLS